MKIVTLKTHPTTEQILTSLKNKDLFRFYLWLTWLISFYSLRSSGQQHVLFNTHSGAIILSSRHVLLVYRSTLSASKSLLVFHSSLSLGTPIKNHFHHLPSFCLRLWPTHFHFLYLIFSRVWFDPAQSSSFDMVLNPKIFLMHIITYG